MSKLLYVEPNDEITDLVDRIRRAGGERDLVFVLSPEGKALRSALDVQLLMQYTRGFQKRIALVTPDPKVQALAIRTGFATFPSVAKFEQGEALTAAQAQPAAVSTTQPQPLAPRGPAVLPAQPGSQRSVASRSSETLAAGAGGSQLGGWWRSATTRRWTIGAGAAIFVVGVLAVLLLLPSATLTVGVQAHELTDNVTLQGTVGGNSKVLDVVPTKSLTTPTESGQFTVTPSGTQVLPPTPATGTVYLYQQQPRGDLLGFSVPLHRQPAGLLIDLRPGEGAGQQQQHRDPGERGQRAALGLDQPADYGLPWYRPLLRHQLHHL